MNLWQDLLTSRFLLSPFDEFMVSNSWIPQCLTLNRARNGALAALCIGVPDLWSMSSTRASGLLGKYTPSWALILLSASRHACFRSGPLGYGLCCTMERNECRIHTTFLSRENKNFLLTFWFLTSILINAVGATDQKPLVTRFWKSDKALESIVKIFPLDLESVFSLLNRSSKTFNPHLVHYFPTWAAQLARASYQNHEVIKIINVRVIPLY